PFPPYVPPKCLVRQVNCRTRLPDFVPAQNADRLENVVSRILREVADDAAVAVWLTCADPCRLLSEGPMPSKSDKLSPQDIEAELRLAESQMSTILAIAADAIISLNENMRIMVFN